MSRRQVVRQISWTVALAVALVGFGASTSVAAAAERTRGAAQAVLEAGLNAGVVIRTRTPGQGMPLGIASGGGPEDVRISLSAESGAYCASGWHMVSLNFLDSATGYPNKQALFASLDQVDVGFTLDGAALTTQRTSIKRFPEGVSDTTDGYWFGVGALLPPGSLTPGEHGLTVTVVDPVAGDDEFTVPFTVSSC
jgi:hypothetical protein